MKPATRAFISYSAIDEAIAERVKQGLSELGIVSFLAHEDITVSEEWRVRILKELSTAKLFVAILSRSFKESEWAPQELGFALGKKIPILPLSIDNTPPFGLIAHLQGFRVRGEVSNEILAQSVARVLPDAIIPGLIEKLSKARSFRGAESLMQPLVPLFPSLTTDHVNELVAVSLDNGQIWDADLCKREYLPELIRVHGRRIKPEMLQELQHRIAQR